VADQDHASRELARIDGHTDQVRGVAAVDWPGADHPLIATTSSDGTAPIWDPARPHAELGFLLPMFAPWVPVINRQPGSRHVPMHGGQDEP
jgi:hypothetical protein